MSEETLPEALRRIRPQVELWDQPAVLAAADRIDQLEALVRWLVGCSATGVNSEDGYGRLGIGFEHFWHPIPVEHIPTITSICGGT